MQIDSRLQSLYKQYDSLINAGDDVVAELKKEIANQELSYLKDFVFPKIARLLNAETKSLRCAIDCSMQVSDGSVSYSFCTETSPLVRDIVTESYSEPSVTYALDVSKIKDLTQQISNMAQEIKAYSDASYDLLNESHGIEKVENYKGDQEGKKANNASGIFLYIRNKYCNATGRLLSDGKIIIQKGSILRAEVTDKYERKDFRENMIKRFCTISEQGIIVKKDLPPMTVSGASGLCLARSANGRVEWTDINGVKLKDLDITQQSNDKLWNL